MSFYQVNPASVDWESADSALFFNPGRKNKEVFCSGIPRLPLLPAHIWLATSGRHFQKWVALSKEALLCSARAVNRHLQVSAEDRWGLSLPLFHVGGLSVLARSHLSRSSCFSYKKGRWSARDFLLFLKQNKITLSSLVPTQVYDIVQEALPCPPSLRAVVVGGDRLPFSLYTSARKLNWPLLPSYGLTECSSQVATAELSSLASRSFPRMKLLSHVQAQMVNQEIVLQSKSLLTGFLPLSHDHQGEFQEPEKKGFYFTGDRGRKEGEFLYVESPDQIKILGEKVHLKSLEEEFMAVLLKEGFSGRGVLLPVPEKRRGFQLVLVSDVFNRPALFRIVAGFNKRVSSFEKIRQVYFLSSFPLTDISKISRAALWEKLGFSPEKPF